MLSLHASNVLPVPKNGSKTHCPFLVKKYMNSITNDSGKLAGCNIFLSPLDFGL